MVSGTTDPNVLARNMEAFSDIDLEMPLITMRIFLFVAARGMVNQKDIEVGLGLSNGATSRNVAYWSDGHKSKKLAGGVGYLDRRADPQDRRYNVISLTKEGREFYNKLLGRTDGKSQGSKVASGRSR